MKHSKWIIPAVMLSGILGFTLAPGWAQSQSGSSGSSTGSQQKEPGTSSSGASSDMKSTDRGTGMGSGTQSSARSSRGQWKKDDIKKVQEALKEKGQDPGPADGILGAQTQKALREFQSKNGLKATGRLDAETAKALGVESGTASESTGASSSTGGSSPSSGTSATEKGSSSKGGSGTGGDSSSRDKNK